MSFKTKWREERLIFSKRYIHTQFTHIYYTSIIYYGHSTIFHIMHISMYYIAHGEHKLISFRMEIKEDDDEKKTTKNALTNYRLKTKVHKITGI